MKTVPEDLREKAALYEERNKQYGGNYKYFGVIMRALFQDGPVVLKTVEDHNRFGIFVQVLAKATRYAAQFSDGGHDDSLDDIAVYSMMLKELDSGIFMPATGKSEPEIIYKDDGEYWQEVSPRSTQVPIPVMFADDPGKFYAYVGTDAMKWAEQFIATIQAPGFEVPNIWDQGFMCGWFANAIEQAKQFGFKQGFESALKKSIAEDVDEHIALAEKIREDERGRIKACYEGVTDANSAQREEWITNGFDPRAHVAGPSHSDPFDALREIAGAESGRPTIAELQAILDSKEDFEVTINHNGSVTATEKWTVGRSEGSGTGEDTGADPYTRAAHARAVRPAMKPVIEEPGNETLGRIAENRATSVLPGDGGNQARAGKDPLG